MLVNSRDLCINYSYRALYIQVQVSARAVTCAENEKEMSSWKKSPRFVFCAGRRARSCPPSCSWSLCPGNSTNPASYPFEVMMLRVKGANMDTIEENPCQEMLDKFIVVCKELAAQGVKAITTSCGFTAYYQEGLAAAVPSWCSPAPCYRSPSSRPWWAPTARWPC